MSNVIDFLERFGSDAHLRFAADDEVEAALKLAGIDQDVRAAIVSKDQRALEALLGADTNVCCIVDKPDEVALRIAEAFQFQKAGARCLYGCKRSLELVGECVQNDGPVRLRLRGGCGLAGVNGGARSFQMGRGKIRQRPRHQIGIV